MAQSEEEAVERITALFEQCRLLHLSAYPSSSVDFDRLNLTGRVTRGRWAHARGHFADVYKGKLDDGTVVAVKALRLPAYSSYDDKIYKDTVLRFFREVNHWSQLDHINIAAMRGYSLSDGTINLVSLWHPNGNLVEYVRSKPDVSKRDLALDVAEGTLYLHSRASPLVHGDLKGANVLINEHGIACLADFGLSKQIDDLNRETGFTTTSGATGTLPFTAPELDTENPRFELPCDVYSCAGVFLQIYCPGKVPFDYINNRFQMNQAKSRGEIPQRSFYREMDGQDRLWQLMSDCWAYKSTQRPNMDLVVSMLYREFKVGQRRLQSDPLRPRVYSLLPQSESSASSSSIHHSLDHSLRENVFSVSRNDHVTIARLAELRLIAQNLADRTATGRPKASSAGSSMLQRLSLSRYVPRILGRTFDYLDAPRDLEPPLDLDLPQQYPAIIETSRPPAYWPSSSTGDVQVENLVVKQKVGLLGRPGSGKSTLAMSLYRFRDPHEGRILIDGIDISMVGLSDLRSRLSILPRDAVLCSGIIRDNLDPYQGYTDEECLDVLARARLYPERNGSSSLSSRAQSTSGGSRTPSDPDSEINTAGADEMATVKLDTQVSAVSQGQKQLIDIARALLSYAAIFIMDEPSASIDADTVTLIQQIVREEFRDSILITIAHRVQTVIDYDRLLIMDGGKIVEFDTPMNLIRKEGGLFRNMCLESGSFDELYHLLESRTPLGGNSGL